MPSAPTAARPTFLFVHGGSSNAQAWGPLRNELALLGHRSYAVDLPGHGFGARRPAAYYSPRQDARALAAEPSPMRGVTLEDNVRHVVGVVRRLAGHGPVILAGNSLGGVTISAVGNAVPELLARIVYISAICLSDARMLTEAWDVPEGEENLLDAAAARIELPGTQANGFARLNWRAAQADPELFAQLKAAIMADASDDLFRALLDSMDPDESYAVVAPDGVVRADRWGQVPHSFLRLTEDRSIPLAVQDRMIAAADALTPDNPFDVHDLAASHVGYVSRPAEFARVLAGLA
ncbi:alpha/beta hydrolase [Streptomyces sp. NPDC052496]|uniref:alpha/beta fold hydrolase n=1 Tax=Streptomyces sp. NPDC052496 TaxID=3154951 RepID=UPI0034354182